MSKWFVGQQVRCYNEDAIIVSLRDGEDVFKGEFEVKYADGDLVIVHPNDLTSIDTLTEETGPIRTVTRREIVEWNDDVLHIIPHEKDCVMVAFVNKGDVTFHSLTADQLREAAHILNQLAEALEDGVV